MRALASTAVFVGGTVAYITWRLRSRPEVKAGKYNGKVDAVVVSPPFPGVSKSEVRDWFGTAANWETINVAAFAGKAHLEVLDSTSWSVVGDDPSDTMEVANVEKDPAADVSLMLTVTSPAAGVSFDVLFYISDSPVVVTRKICAAAVPWPISASFWLSSSSLQ